jgi:hypothetical protein
MSIDAVRPAIYAFPSGANLFHVLPPNADNTACS